jgi:hypothetical protein
VHIGSRQRNIAQLRGFKSASISSVLGNQKTAQFGKVGFQRQSIDGFDAIFLP